MTNSKIKSIKNIRNFLGHIFTFFKLQKCFECTSNMDQHVRAIEIIVVQFRMETTETKIHKLC